MTGAGTVPVEILDRIQDGFCAVDREWRIVYANRAACDICGTTAESVLGRALWDCFPKPLRREIEGCLSRSVEARGMSECEPVFSVAGRRLWLCAAAIRPGVTGLLLRNITERKHADARHQEVHPFHPGPEGAGVGMWEWDLKNNAIYWSPEMFRLLGIDPLYSSKDLYQAWLRVVHPDDRDRVNAHSQRRRLECGLLEFDYRILTPDGAVRWILGKGMTVTLDEGRPVRVAGIDIDITQHKRVEVEFRRLTEELEARVGQRTRELADANERLRRERLLSELIIESASEGIIVVVRELRHLVWNARMESIIGRSCQEVLGRTVFEVDPGFADHPVGHAWREALAGRKAEIRENSVFLGRARCRSCKRRRFMTRQVR